ncbi:MAG: sigma 54-interacting transcriptional regulator, partial [Deltaproteobacteria bacterium]|nr:sigma 54-interacting transcriptional regulator [Deltaproteobacteria bacterium]
GTTGGVDRQLGWARWLEVNKRLASEHNVQRLLEYIMDSAILLTGAERGFLLLADDSAKEGMEVRIARNLDQENIRHRHMKISRGIARRVMESGEPVLTVDAMEDDRYKEQLSVHDLRLRSILCLPMAFRGRVLGAIYLDNRFRSSAFQDDDVRFMEAFADLAAIALDNARLVESLEAQRKDLDAARREVEALNARLAEELAARTKELAESHATIIEERRHHSGTHIYENIVGGSAPMRKLFAMLDRLKSADVPVLIEGESGTGKELVARAIHFAGTRGERPFVAINCGAIPATLLESELFGHVRGAFTNATSDKKGLFEVAHTGTLLLDEIGELPLEMQVKLL